MSSLALCEEGTRFDWPASAPMTFRQVVTGGNCSSCGWIAAEGVINERTPQEFSSFVAKVGAGPGAIIRFNSTGGNLLAGLKLGAIVRALNADTTVGKSVGKEGANGVVWTDPNYRGDVGSCASACVLAFAGGVQRYAVSTVSVGFQETGRLGVHQFYDPRALEGMDKKIFDALDRSRDQLLVGLILEQLLRFGVSSELIAIASKTPWTEVRWLSDEELKRTNLDNIGAPPNVRLIGYKNGVATVSIDFARADATYQLELFCDPSNQVGLRAKIRSRAVIEPEIVKSWALYDNVSLPNGVRLRKLKMQLSKSLGGGTDLDILFVLLGTNARSIAQITRFQFEDGSSRTANEFAVGMSFDLPDTFDGLHVLPKACSRTALK